MNLCVYTYILFFFFTLLPNFMKKLVTFYDDPSMLLLELLFCAFPESTYDYESSFACYGERNAWHSASESSLQPKQENFSRIHW